MALTFEYKKNIVSGVCQRKGCSRKAKTLCGSCYCKKKRVDDPELYAYNNLKNHAKARGIMFTISIDQFRKFCVKTNYIGLKGRSSEGLSIDRIHNDIGYHADNIQPKTNRENIQKFFEYDYQTKRVKIGEIVSAEINPSDLPF